MRAGTTSLVDLLSKHPDIYVPPIKEPNFFTEDLPKELYSPPKNFSIDRYFEKDFPNKRLHIAHIKKKEHYEKLYSGVKNEKYLLDASTAYLHAPGVAQRIYEYNPEAKIIVLLRDPMDRLISHLAMDMGLGQISKNVDTIINEEIHQFRNNNLLWYSHLNFSFYQRNIISFRDLFAESLTLRFEDLSLDNDKIFEQLNQFLHVKFFTSKKIPKLNSMRKSFLGNSFNRFYQNHLKNSIKTFMSDKSRQTIFKIITSSRKSELNLQIETKKHLKRVFSNEHNWLKSNPY